MVRTTTAVVIIIVIPREKKGQLTASKLCSKLDSIDEDDRETTFFPSTIDIHSLPFLFFFRFQEAPTTPRNSPSSTPTRAPRWSCPQTGEREGDKKTDILGMLLLSFGFFFPSSFLISIFMRVFRLKKLGKCTQPILSPSLSRSI